MDVAISADFFHLITWKTNEKVMKLKIYFFLKGIRAKLAE
jgi:hypothetical protein